MCQYPCVCGVCGGGMYMLRIVGGGMYMLRIVSMDKILHFMHTLMTIIITLP